MTRRAPALGVLLLVALGACERVSRASEESARAATGASAQAAADSSATASVDSALAANDSTSSDSTAPDSADTASVVPTTYTSADSTLGASLFRTRGQCFTCHGMRAQGVTGLGPALTDTTWLRGTGSIAEISQVIRDGVAQPVTMPIRMPSAASVLTESEITQVAEYVYSLTHAPAAAQQPDSR